MIRILQGDCRDVLRTLDADSFDSVVTDPPYHLTSIVKRFGAENAAPLKGNGAFQRGARGFMGKTWDGGDVAFQAETWAEVFRVMKPGAHLAAFGGTRTFHRMACAIEDAGFEIRDTLCWLYGSGFPKSHDVSKGIDKRPGVARHPEFAADLRAAMATKGYTNTFDVAEKVIGRRTGAVTNWQKYQWPEAKWWPALRDLLGMSEEKWGSVIAEAERIKTGERSGNLLAVAPGQDNDRSAVMLDVSAPATDAARQWSGWGTALKPAYEPIILARKPLSEGTIVANVLRHGCGAINVDGCRVHADDAQGGEYTVKRLKPGATLNATGGNWRPEDGEEYHGNMQPGRWPANVVHDGSEEVLEVFPDAPGQQRRVGPEFGEKKSRGIYGDYGPLNEHEPRGDSGSAARFFYTAKADKQDRLQSKHPTVKPVDLIRWLARLITPPGGLVLDCFAGSGTTGMAAMAEGFSAVLIEREAEYIADIQRRIAHVDGADAPLFAEVAQ